MESIDLNLSRLEDSLESAAFLVSKGDSVKEAHAEIVKALVILNEIRSIGGTSSVSERKETRMDFESREINKVTRRLGLWAKRQDQINAKILNAYLRLEQSGTPVITQKMLHAELSGEASFETNFLQMRIIAKKNHGKLFEQYGDQITIWPPVEYAVRKYERNVFGD